MSIGCTRYRLILDAFTVAYGVGILLILAHMLPSKPIVEISPQGVFSFIYMLHSCFIDIVIDKLPWLIMLFVLVLLNIVRIHVTRKRIVLLFEALFIYMTTLNLLQAIFYLIICLFLFKVFGPFFRGMKLPCKDTRTGRELVCLQGFEKRYCIAVLTLNTGIAMLSFALLKQVLNISIPLLGVLLYLGSMTMLITIKCQKMIVNIIKNSLLGIPPFGILILIY